MEFLPVKAYDLIDFGNLVEFNHFCSSSSRQQSGSFQVQRKEEFLHIFQMQQGSVPRSGIPLDECAEMEEDATVSRVCMQTLETTGK